jgi:hypothetical protein
VRACQRSSEQIFHSSREAAPHGLNDSNMRQILAKLRSLTPALSQREREKPSAATIGKG